MICPSLTELLDITDGLDVVVREGIWYFLIIKYLAFFFAYSISHVQNDILVCLFDLILYVPVNNFSMMLGWVFLGLTVLSRK